MVGAITTSEQAYAVGPTVYYKVDIGGVHIYQPLHYGYLDLTPNFSGFLAFYLDQQ